MTCIAWDGRTLAADKRVDCNGYPATAIKIFRAPDGALIGGAGDSDVISALREWYQQGCNPEMYPNNRAEGGCYATLLVITPAKEVRMYLSGPSPIILQNKMFAIGSGADFALASMHLGHSARKAVEVACALDVGCGNGIDTLRLE
jgi:ATP-dependent protease HslVU (ClpYQ) peptidase subunit